MPLRTMLLHSDLRPIRKYFSCVPQAHILYVVPPACCRCRWFEHEVFDGPGRISFLYLDDTDIALGNFTAQIIEALHRILPRLKDRPKAIQVSFTCAFEVLGVDYSDMVEELESTFPHIRFYTFPIHHLTTQSSVQAPENRELSLYRALRDPLPTDPAAVNVVDFVVEEADENELRTALLDCGITTLRQPVLMSTYHEFCQMTASCLNLQIGRMGGPSCKFMEETFGIPTLVVPETYSPRRVQEGIGSVYAYFNKPERSVEDRVSSTLARGKEVAALFEGHSLGLLEANTIDTVDLALALHEMGFALDLVNLLFPTITNQQLLAELQEKAPHVRLVNTRDQANIVVTPETVLIGSPCASVTGSDLFFRAHSHGDPYGFARIEHLLSDLESFARRKL